LKDKYNIFYNLWLGILYELNGNINLSKKYFAITKRLKLKLNNKIQNTESNEKNDEVLNTRNVEPVELTNQHNEPDKHLYDGVTRAEKVSLSDDEFDEIIYSCIDYVYKYNLKKITNSLLNLIKNTNNSKYKEYKIN